LDLKKQSVSEGVPKSGKIIALKGSFPTSVALDLKKILIS
jgi:hypothetical protein